MKKILFIEEDLLQINSMIKRLSRRGYSIEIATDVSKAEQAIKENYDLIILNLNLPKNDLKLPNLYGMEGGVHILSRMEEMNLSTPVIIYSNYMRHLIIPVLREHNIRIPEILEKGRYDSFDELNDLINRMISGYQPSENGA